MKESLDIKPFNQVPYWDGNTEFKLSGTEFKAIFSFINLFVPTINAVQSSFEKAIQEGKAHIKYEYQDGSGEVPQETLAEYSKQVKQMMEEQLTKLDIKE